MDEILPEIANDDPSSTSKGSKENSTRAKKASSKLRHAKIKQFAETSTLHGIYEIVTSKTIVAKLFWLIAFLVALGVAFYECYAIVREYLDSPVVVSYHIKVTGALDLPDIVICPFNRFSAPFMKEHNISEPLLDYIQLSFGLGGQLYEFQHNLQQPDTNGSLARQLDELLVNFNMSFGEFVHAAGVPCYKIIRHCMHPQVGMFNCCEVVESVMTSVGKCYRIPGGRQEAAGYGFGMIIIMNIPYDEFTPSKNNIHNDGIAVKLTEKNKGLDYDLTFIPSGVHALMPLRASKFEFINDPPRYTCLTTTMTNYSRVSCFDDCIFNPGIRSCNCTHVATNQKNPLYSACTTHQFYDCLLTTVMQTITQNADFIMKCRDKCLQNCTYWQFETTVSYARFPAPTISEFVYSIAEMEQYNSTIILDVYYENLEYTLIKHFPSMTPDTFIANIGGQIGLWVGGSIITVLQLIVFCVQVMFAGTNIKSAIAIKPSKKQRNRASRRSNRVVRAAINEDATNSPVDRPWNMQSTSSIPSENKFCLSSPVSGIRKRSWSADKEEAEKVWVFMEESNI